MNINQFKNKDVSIIINYVLVYKTEKKIVLYFKIFA